MIKSLVIIKISFKHLKLLQSILLKLKKSIYYMQIFYNIQSILTFILIGLIWTIQIVHYPLFEYISKENFAIYHSKHSQLISILVIPLMCSELLILSYLLKDSQHYPTIYYQFFCVVIIWCSTFFLQVPLHNSLGISWDPNTVKKLVQTNWIRTFFWTLKGFFIIWSFFKTSN